ncbi:MAG: ribosomal protein S18-alanine N-acetyltransferase [Clostridia bacterium]|nr:ribosomal protein S18-alanine N-acetyltransferase [Clostridia bacterium]
MIRAMRVEDLPQIMPIEDASFLDPWTKEMFLSSLEIPLVRGFVCEKEAEVVGYLLGSVIFEEAEVYNVAVSPDYRKRGIGERLLETFEKSAKGDGATTCFLEVRVGNLPARTLYEKKGYAQIAVRKKYYADGEDALVMQKTL